MHSLGLHRTILFKYVLPKFQEKCQKGFLNGYKSYDCGPSTSWDLDPLLYDFSSFVLVWEWISATWTWWWDSSYVLHFWHKIGLSSYAEVGSIILCVFRQANSSWEMAVWRMHLRYCSLWRVIWISDVNCQKIRSTPFFNYYAMVFTYIFYVACVKF